VPPTSEDDLTSIKNPDYIEEKIRSNIVRKIILEDSYHMITIDNQKDRVAEERLNFLWSKHPLLFRNANE
jgi:carboxylesterase